MNLYLHYGVGHKQSVLKSNDKAKSNPKHTIKHKKSTQDRSCRQNKTPPETARVAHALPLAYPLQQPNTRNPRAPPDTTKDAERGHHARPKVCSTPWRVMTTRRSPMSFPAVTGSD